MLSKKITDYFKGDELASEVFLNKYSLNKEETPDDMHKRMAKEFARIIFNYRDKITEDKIRNLSPYGQGFFRILKIQTKEDLQDMIHHYFKNFEFIVPQGSVMSGLSSEKPVSLSNCFVLPSPEDTIESIVNTGRNAAQIYKRRGGVGFDISNLRPKGASVNNASSLSTGAVSFMPLYSMITEIIGQDGRRGALMLSIDINHPDVMDFATIKRDLTKVTGANISIKLNKKFINAVENNEDYILRWPLETNISNLPINDIVYNELKFFYTKEGSPYYIKKVKAKELWDIIVESNWLSAEPGIFNWDLLINYDPTGVYNELRPISTNPCGELGLSGYDSCRLILTNLYSLIKNPFEEESKFDEVLGYSVFYFTQILADALVDLEIEAIDRVLNKIQPDYEKFIRGYNTVSDFLSEQSEEFKLWWKIREIGEKGRRTGTGITAYGDMCAALGLKYGDKGLTESVFKTKLRAELDSTTDLAIILEPFPLWDKTKEFEFYDENEIKGRNEWYQFIIDELPIQAKRMAYWGRRNSGISTVAPAGSVSILTQTTSGIEPLFSPYYTRRKKCNRNEKPDFVDQNGVGFKNFLVVHPKLKEYAEIKKEFFTKSFHQFPENIEEYNAENWDVVYNYSPYAHNTSDTIPLDVRIDTQALIQKYITSSISSTCNVPKEFTREQMSEGYLRAFEKGCKGLTYYRDGSRSGILFTGKDNDKEEFPQYDATKRKKTLDAELHMSKSKGRHFAFIVGLLEGKPYEIFGYDTLGEKLKECKGTITRVKKGHYRFESDDLIIDNISDESNSELEKACTIYTSMLLRTGAKIEYVISVSKNKINNNISSFVSSMCRVLNKYNKTIDYLVCDSCGGEVRLENGCQTCMNCGDSKCN